MNKEEIEKLAMDFGVFKSHGSLIIGVCIIKAAEIIAKHINKNL